MWRNTLGSNMLQFELNSNFLDTSGFTAIKNWGQRAVATSFRVPRKIIPRVFFHGAILACIISGFWLLDSLKDPIFRGTVGMEYQPAAKGLSVFSTLIVVVIYDYLSAVFSKTNLFHLVALFFGSSMLVMAALLADKDLGLMNRDRGPHRWLGWISYFAIEAYGSLMVAIFWSFTNSLMNLEEAKGSYGLIIAIAQLGAILGSTLATHSKDLGIAFLMMIAGLLILSNILLMKAYRITFKKKLQNIPIDLDESICRSASATPSSRSIQRKSHKTEFDNPNIIVESHSDDYDQDDHHDTMNFPSITIPSESEDKDTDEPKEAPKVPWYNRFEGIGEGFGLILRYPYVLRLLGVSCLYEIVVTILDYEFKIIGANSVEREIMKKMAGDQHFDAQAIFGKADDAFVNLLGHFGQATNIMSFIVSFFGFSFMVDNLGVRGTLLLFPLTLLVAVVIVHLVPSLWVFFVFVSVLKAMIFSVQDPTKELLYIPTSLPIKYRAKAWIDVFGSRFAKALGSAINGFSGGDSRFLRSYSEIPCLVLSCGIVVLSWIAGTHFERLVKKQEIVGEEAEEREEIELTIKRGSRGSDTFFEYFATETEEIEEQNPLLGK